MRGKDRGKGVDTRTGFGNGLPPGVHRVAVGGGGGGGGGRIVRGGGGGSGGGRGRGMAVVEGRIPVEVHYGFFFFLGGVDLSPLLSGGRRSQWVNRRDKYISESCFWINALFFSFFFKIDLLLFQSLKFALKLFFFFSLLFTRDLRIWLLRRRLISYSLVYSIV